MEFVRYADSARVVVAIAKDRFRDAAMADRPALARQIDFPSASHAPVVPGAAPVPARLVPLLAEIEFLRGLHGIACGILDAVPRFGQPLFPAFAAAAAGFSSRPRDPLDALFRDADSR